jgi:hypothetical protein
MYRRFIVLIACWTLLLGCSQKIPVKVDKDGGFQLKEISLIEAGKNPRDNHICGQYVFLGFKESANVEDATVPKKAVKKYPELKGPKPLYGSVKFDQNYLKPETGIEYQFVIDATGSEGYDRLYFDANRDLDLTNDPSLALTNEYKPKCLWPGSKDRMFEELSVPMDFGPGYGVRTVKIMPFLNDNKNDAANYTEVVIFFVNLSFHAGTIKIGDKPVEAVLAQQRISGRFDRPNTTIYLREPEEKQPWEQWWGAQSLGAYRYVGGQYFTISATPIGDKLFVKPYTGKLGVFKIGPGGRDIKDMTASGSLYSPDHAVAIGNMPKTPGTGMQPVGEWQAPVGDYTARLKINYGPLRIGVDSNDYSDGKGQDIRRQRKFAILIQEDKPFVLDFSNKPVVMFAKPAKDSIFKPGDRVEIDAVLIDPILDIKIDELTDTRQKVKEEIYLRDGKKVTREIDKSLVPNVTISDSSGKIVAEGPMPFG